MNISLDELHPLTLTLLKKRGVEKSDMMDFLNPSYEKHVGDPFQIYGMPKAVERILLALHRKEKIAIYSDYDCDGIPGGVLLREFFDGIGYPVDIYVPHRHNEGYGVHNHAVDLLKDKGVSLIITVDLAITNIEEIAYAKSVGVDFIVTDHHLPITVESEKVRGESGLLTPNSKLLTVQIVPDAVAVINSKQDLCTYSDDMLCGCAVAWKLACAVLSQLRVESVNDEVYQKVQALPLGWEKWMLDLVGISTIADMVPLQKENRALAHYGLRVLQKTKRPGLLHIFNEQRMKKENLTEEDIAFTIAPRINAAGRMGSPIQAHHMLYEKDIVKAENFARDLELLNTERKAGVKDITEGISFDHAVYQNNVVVVGDMSWGPGILGLIAQKIIDETGKPTFVWGRGGAEVSEPAEENRSTSEERGRVPQLASEGTQGNANVKIKKGEIKGSCRSKGDVHVVELMARVQELFPGVITHSGGHEQAGGFSCAVDRIGELSQALNEAYKHVELQELGNQEILIDAELVMDDIHEVTYRAISPLAPFGVGNPKPVFSFKDVTPLSVRRFGKKSEHLEVVYPRSKGEVKAIIFFAPKDLEERAKKKHTLLAHIEKSVFRGKTELRLRIKEVI